MNGASLDYENNVESEDSVNNEPYQATEQEEEQDIIAKELMIEITTFGTEYLTMPVQDCLYVNDTFVFTFRLILREYRLRCARLNLYKECETISQIINKLKIE